MSLQQPGGFVLPDPNVVLAWAQFYAFTMDWVLQPIHKFMGYAENGRKLCSCELTGQKWNNCNPEKPGKHPWKGWKQAPMETPEQGYATFKAVWDQYPHGVNIGIRTGRVSNIWALDLDVGGGKNGVAEMELWLQNQKLEWKDLSTLSAQTGGGGYHFVYSYPNAVEKITTVAGHEALGNAVDVKGDGGFILVAPSVHASGATYAWRTPISPGDVKRSPDKLTNTVRAQDRTPGHVSVDYTPSMPELRDYADELIRKKGRSHEVGSNMLVALGGVAIATEGGAHDDYRDIMYFIAKRWPTCDAKQILSYFEDSVTDRFAHKNNASTDMANLLDSMSTALAKANAEAKSWVGQVALNNQGKPIANDANIYLFMKNHDAWSDKFGYNLRKNKPVYLKQPPIQVPPGDVEMTRDKTKLALWFQTQTKMFGRIAREDMQSALIGVAQERSFDPLQEYVLSLRGRWDGVPRLETAFQRVAGTTDSPWIRLVFPTWFRSLIARLLYPGCKCDTMLILEGSQGFKKSTFFASLLPDGEYFSDSLNRVRHDVESIRLVHSGPAIFEIGELSGLKKQEVEEIKAFLSARHDDLRPLFEGYRSTKRRCIFVGTTNRNDYLRDETGGRRFWPLRVEKIIDIETVAKERDQWFAEALAHVEAGWPWWLHGDHENLLAQYEQQERYEEDIWTQPILVWLELQAKEVSPQHANTATGAMTEHLNKVRAGVVVTTQQVAENALKLDIKDARAGEGFRINKIMRNLGWLPIRTKVADKQIRAWQRP